MLPYEVATKTSINTCVLSFHRTGWPVVFLQKYIPVIHGDDESPWWMGALYTEMNLPGLLLDLLKDNVLSCIERADASRKSSNYIPFFCVMCCLCSYPWAITTCRTEWCSRTQEMSVRRHQWLSSLIPVFSDKSLRVHPWPALRLQNTMSQGREWSYWLPNSSDSTL